MLYNIVLFSGVQWNESAICIHIPLPLGPPQSSRSSQRMKLNSLCYTAGSHYLFYTWWCIYVNSNLPVPHLRPHPMSRCVSSVSVSPLLRCNRFICTIFLDSTYIFKIFHGPLMGSWALTCSLLCPVEKLAWPKGKCVEEVWGWTLQGAVWDHTVGWGGASAASEDPTSKRKPGGDGAP